MDGTSDPEKLHLLLGGDTMLGRRVNEAIRREGFTYPLEAIVATTRAADLFLVNLECAITPRKIEYSGPEKAFYFRADPVAADTLAYAGVDLVSLANNHALDADYDGLRDTLAILDEKEIFYVGAGTTIEAATRPAFLEAKGMRLGVLAYCDHQHDFAAGVDRPGIRYTDLSDPDTPARLAREVEALARQVDHVIVAFHWQHNWVPRVSSFYRSLARQLVEAGARIIWGHSPHHFQGVEWIGGSVVLYATGDLVEDYQLVPEFRNDRQLLFELLVSQQRVEQVRAYPLELKLSRTRAADAEARHWITERFSAMCGDLGSRVEQQGEWLGVLPGS